MRAEIQRRARQIRQQGQLEGWSMARIATTILNDEPDLHPLEAWRLAYGWSRPQVIESIGAQYMQDGLAAPAINPSMLCRWEHGDAQPGSEYSKALCQLYRACPEELGLPTRAPTVVVSSARLRGSQAENEYARPADHERDHGRSGGGGHTLTAVRESIEFAVEAEGPGGGPLVRDQLDLGVQYFALHYSAFPPGMLAAEVHRCRGLLATMLGHTQEDVIHTEICRLGGWLSALLGNLVFHCADYAGADIHLGSAAGLGAKAGDNQLVAWALGALSMSARYQDRPTKALELASRAVDYADTPLRRAQAIAWAKLPALAHLHRRGEARDAIIAARREMDADPQGEQPGRFGFDAAELELHLAEAELELGDAAAAAVYAQASLGYTIVGRPSWAAATLTLARSDAQRGRPDQGAELALHVLDTIPIINLRQTSRQRLAGLDDYLAELGQPGAAAADLHERLRLLPPLGLVPPTPNSGQQFAGRQAGCEPGFPMGWGIRHSAPC
jgi:hypothetical protein